MVTLAQILMPIKIGATFQNKLRPSGQGGTVVQTASILGILSQTMSTCDPVAHVYTAAKFALIGLTR